MSFSDDMLAFLWQIRIGKRPDPEMRMRALVLANKLTAKRDRWLDRVTDKKLKREVQAAAKKAGIKKKPVVRKLALPPPISFKDDSSLCRNKKPRRQREAGDGAVT